MGLKSVFLYLVLVYAFAAGVQATGLAKGITPFAGGGARGWALFVALMVAPALAALLAGTILRQERPVRGRIWPVPKLASALVILGVPAVFVVIWTLTRLFGWCRFDFSGRLLIQDLPAVGVDRRLAARLPGAFYVFFGFVLSILVGCTVYAALCLGNETGWRGYLLPRLMPLGRVRAYCLSGLLWGISLAPMVLFFAPTWPVRLRGAVQVLAMSIAFAAVLGEVWRRTGSLGAASLCAGSFLGQVLGLWPYIVLDQKAPWAGPFGVVSIVVWGIVALGLMAWPDGKAGKPGSATEP